MERERTYVCIDLKSFYASVECVRRGLDPMTTRLVVADPTRSEMTICLAVSPAMKAAGVKNRCRLYEIPEGIDYITAQPRMNSYMEVSAEIYGTYLRYVSQEDIHPYSIDECFIDATPYLELYDLTAREFADTLRSAVLAETGIPATVGIGPNLFLAKVALDISAKHALDGIIANLVRGDVVRCRYYEDGGYRVAEGAVSQIDLTFRDLWIVRRRIPFSAIQSLEMLYPAG